MIDEVIKVKYDLQLFRIPFKQNHFAALKPVLKNDSSMTIEEDIKVKYNLQLFRKDIINPKNHLNLSFARKILINKDRKQSVEREKRKAMRKTRLAGLVPAALERRNGGVCFRHEGSETGRFMV